MFPPLSSIRKMRRKLGWTQKELAKRSGVSQSTIAKIERGRMVPSYDTAVKIFTALYRGESEDGEMTVDKIMHQGVMTASPTESVHGISEKMKREGISQLPVIDGDKVVGMITEEDINAAFLEHGKDASILRVAEIMGPPPPIVGKKTKIKAVAELLKQYSAVVIVDGEEMVGIATRADIVYWVSSER